MNLTMFDDNLPYNSYPTYHFHNYLHQPTKDINNSNPFFSFCILLHFDNAHCHILSQLEQTSFKLVFSNQVYKCFWVAYIGTIAILELSYDTKQNI